MIRAIRSDHESFRSVTFSPGFNLILADQTEKSTDRDTRNGVGKSLLVSIIHFCLGSDFSKTNPLRKPELLGWTFTVTLILQQEQFDVSRNTANPGVVGVVGDFSAWSVKPEFNIKSGRFEFSIKEWTGVLGSICFALPNVENRPTYTPAFRNLISYFVRNGRDSFSSPFENHKNTSEGEKQVYSSFLLGLNWDYARQFQIIKDRRDILSKLRSAAKVGLLPGFMGTIGELQAEKVRLEDEAKATEANLRTFKVHQQYEEIEKQANSLTREIHEASNRNVSTRQILHLYESSARDEVEPSLSDVETVYSEVGIVFPDAVQKRFGEVRQFHEQLTANRRQFLEAEIRRLSVEIESSSAVIKAKTGERAELMMVLNTHGALAEFTKLQQLHLAAVQKINDLDSRIQNLRAFEDGMSNLRIDLENLQQATRRDLNERDVTRKEAISLFNANSHALYEVPGRLIIDVKDTGYFFDVDIERSGSEGIDSMEIYCYDLMLAQLWAEKPISPRILAHDSTLFDAVDERQIAHALRLAESKSTQFNFQYICLMNTDSLPKPELMGDWDFKKFVRITLTDQLNGCLLGIRY